LVIAKRMSSKGPQAALVKPVSELLPEYMPPPRRPAAPFGNPKSPPVPVIYRGAKIYTSHTKLAYRYILNPMWEVSDRIVRWQGDHVGAWSNVLDTIDARRAALDAPRP
jgi:hypothetical protein